MTQQASPTPPHRLLVGTKQAPPFAIKHADGTWSGISIELWQAIADELHLTYTWQEFDLQGLLVAVQQGRVDAAVAALTLTAAREQLFDFSHPFYTTGLGIAVKRDSKGHWWSGLQRLLSWKFLEIIAALVSLLGLVGMIVWLCERTHNPQQFGRGMLRGVGTGIWWAAVTMTTVGYGDKAPVTVIGRLVALVWMFAAIMMISGFTAAITTVLTVHELGQAVRGPEDLPRVRIGAAGGTTSAAYLQERHLPFHPYPEARSGLQALVQGDIDALVYDAPLLRYLALTEFQETVDVLPGTFERQDYGLAFPTGSALREPINRIILEKIHQPAWQNVLIRYLGP
jgi:ABC-type amino acid transport substrate-binding protein